MSTAKKTDPLRKRAEELVDKTSEIVPRMSTEEIHKLVYELNTHQIELQMQNEALRRSEQELTEARDRYARLYDFTPVGYLSISEKGLILEANLTTSELLVVDRDKLMKQSLSDFIVEQDQDTYFLMRNKLLNTRKRYTGELRMRRANGKQFWGRLEGVLDREAEVDQKRISYALTDITVEKLAVEEALKASRLESLGLLAGGIAHDFNNLLTSIMGTFDLVLASNVLDSQYTKWLKDAQSTCLRATDLTGQLLTFARGGAPIKQTCSISKIIRESTSLSMHGSNLEIDYSLPENLFTVEVDPGQIEQVVRNLIINARHAMTNGGCIEVRARNLELRPREVAGLEEGKYVEFSVRDSGVGISPQNLNKMFEPYFTTKEKGHGLGLATAYSIIKRHQGLITVESTLGQGSTFTVFLPASDQPPLEEKSSSVQEEKLPLLHKRIILMEDDRDNRRLIGRILKTFGGIPVLARHGKEAIDLYNKSLASGTSIDVVILDLTIQGGMGGKETMKILREIDPNIKSIVFSGYSNDPVVAEPYKYGFNAALKKPFKTDDFIQIIKKIIDTKI